MNIKEAVENGILKKEFKDLEKSKVSLEIAENNLREAESLYNFDKYRPSIIFSYTAMFHAGRSLLFKEGYREKWHIGIIVFLEETYSGKIGKRLIQELDRLRRERHDILYSLKKEDINGEDAKHALSIAKEFIEKIKELL